MRNAGLPENVGGRAHYKLTPKELADYHEMFVKELGGKIWVESEGQGKGSTFVIELPAGKAGLGVLLPEHEEKF